MPIFKQVAKRNMHKKPISEIVLEALEDLKGVDTVTLDVRHLTSITDTMIICTGTSNRHVKSLAQNVVTSAKKYHIIPLSVEGEREGEWVLIDLGDAMIHIMLQRIRDFYGLEKLWNIPTPPKEA